MEKSTLESLGCDRDELAACFDEESAQRIFSSMCHLPTIKKTLSALDAVDEAHLLLSKLRCCGTGRNEFDDEWIESANKMFNNSGAQYDANSAFYPGDWALADVKRICQSCQRLVNEALEERKSV